MSKPRRPPKPNEPLTPLQKRNLKQMGILLLVWVVGMGIFLSAMATWKGPDYPREVAESAPHAVFQTEDGTPGSWEYLDDDLEAQPLGECVQIDGWRNQRPWQCTSADESHVFTFRHPSGRASGGFQDEALTVDGDDVPISCEVEITWNALFYCAPLWAISTPEG
ncbi:hypothetical protein FRIG_01695 [Frigoribacterium faeni]|uniref:hypothetical protein n=1 Tax=Frigoribacterium faeni TaxID=145483 RepID=UPI001FAC891B|nr:hypothetical protein [Frigoribacterium faeni]MCJ0699851.1 hypothetical protein [Frigoribacterium faeni]